MNVFTVYLHHKQIMSNITNQLNTKKATILGTAIKTENQNKQLYKTHIIFLETFRTLNVIFKND